MATAEDGNLKFYPAFCFRASPTHFIWVKMAAADVHRLKRRPGFEGMPAYLSRYSLLGAFAGCCIVAFDILIRFILCLVHTVVYVSICYYGTTWLSPSQMA
jgi:hypothetical protein